MTGHSDPDLQTLHRDLDRLTRDAEELAESLQGESRLAGEETLGAELVAGRELTALAGILWETAEQLSDLFLRQARLFAQDHTATLRSLVGDSVPQSFQAVVDHQRRHHAGGR